MKSFSGMFAAVAFSGLSAVGASAVTTTYNADFNSNGSATYTGTGPTGTGGTWNGVDIGSGFFSSFTSGTLVDSAGGASTIQISFGPYNGYVDTGGPFDALFSDFAYQTGGVGGGTPTSFSFTGLNPLATYDLYLISQNTTTPSTITTFVVGGVSKSADAASNDPNTNFNEGGNYVVYSGLTPTGNGSISGTFDDAKPADNAAFNGFQLVQTIVTPEPASVGLIALSSAGLLGRRRRV